MDALAAFRLWRFSYASHVGDTSVGADVSGDVANGPFLLALSLQPRLEAEMTTESVHNEIGGLPKALQKGRI